MTLSALERLDLTDKLDELMVSAMSANGLDLLDLNDEIDRVMEQLGYGVAAAEAVPDSPVVIPQIVADFLAGAFVKQSHTAFLDTLRNLSEFVGQFISLDQVKEQSENWVEDSGFSL
jgi:hypothetical protein